MRPVDYASTSDASSANETKNQFDSRMMVDFQNKYQQFAGGWGSYKNLIYRGFLVLILIHLVGMHHNKASCHVTNTQLFEIRCGSNTVNSRGLIAIFICLYPSYTHPQSRIQFHLLAYIFTYSCIRANWNKGTTTLRLRFSCALSLRGCNLCSSHCIWRHVAAINLTAALFLLQSNGQFRAPWCPVSIKPDSPRGTTQTLFPAWLCNVTIVHRKGS